jgi:hypothetical protein
MLTPADFQAMRGAYQAIAAAAHRGHSTGQSTYCQFCDRGRGIHGGATGQNSTRRGPMPLPAKRGQRVAECAIDARELVPARSEVIRVRVGRDVSRCYERLDESDLARPGRAAEAELKAFFTRNPHLAGWQDRLRIVALAQGGAEHYLHGRRGIRDHPPEYTGRAVDVAFWVIPDRTSAVAGLREWLTARSAKHVNPERKPDLMSKAAVTVCPTVPLASARLLRR